MSKTQLEKHYLVVSTKGALIMTENKDKAMNTLKASHQKGYNGYIQEIVANTERIKEIGKNIFTRKPSEEERKNILKIREKVIRTFMDIRDENDYTDKWAWKKTVEKCNLTNFSTLEEFSQYTLDIIEFNPHNNLKLLENVA
jgi:hypothetical protein